MKIKSIRQAKKLTGKRVIVRADFNVPMEKTRIEDDFKIIAGLPTIRFLLRHKCKVIIATHLGRPKGKRSKIYSTKPIANRLSKILGKKVKFSSDAIGFKAGTEVSKLKEGQVLMLENLRFYKGEEKNSKRFARELARLADLYVNDAFGVCHRNHASIVAIRRYLPVFAGVLLEDEILHLNKLNYPERPLILVIGGVKINTKIKLIKKLYKKAHRILIGGALANNFFVAHKLEVGNSVIDRASIKFAKQFKKKNVILPIDVVVSTRKDGRGKPEVKNVYTVKKNETILDIGPQTIKLYNHFIKKAKTIIWNGPMGMFEAKHYKHGTLGVARVIAARSGGPTYGVAGGGETVAALNETKMREYVDWVSTGGGAMLAYLSGEKMPGLRGIVK